MSRIEQADFDQNALDRLHAVQVEILDEIAKICECHGLRYYMVGGTLLGAVRHKGFIPWDDDLDIAMPRPDYEMFCRLCLNGALSSQYYLHNAETDENYWLIFGKVRKQGTALEESSIAGLPVWKGIYVDIFPFDDAIERGTSRQKLRTRRIKMLSTAICGKVGTHGKRGWKAKLILYFLRPFSISQLTKWQYKLMVRENGKNGSYYINFGSNYDTVQQTIAKDKYEPFVLLPFEGKMYRAPRDYDFVLRQIYGDYMELPPVESRVLRHKPLYVDFGED